VDYEAVQTHGEFFVGGGLESFGGPSPGAGGSGHGFGGDQVLSVNVRDGSRLANVGVIAVELFVDAGFAGDDRRTVQYEPYLGPVSSHTFVSARLGTEINHFSLSFFVDNLLDSHTITSIAHTPLYRAGPQPPVSPLYTYTTFRPRTFVLTFIYRN